MKKILLIGGGGREHAIAQALKRSPQNPQIYNLAPNLNPGIGEICEEVHICDLNDFDSILKYAASLNLDFAVIGPDDPIGAGLTDALENLNIPTFAPCKVCAQIESSKSFTRNLLDKYQIEGSPSVCISTQISEKQKREDFYKEWNGNIVVKADGLLGGKGVIVSGEHFDTFDEAEDFAKMSIQKFGSVLLEEKLIGEEFSLMSIVDGTTLLHCPAIQDHKRAFENDQGPNTGGMGTISDKDHKLPFLSDKDIEQATAITEKTMKALKTETGKDFVGVLYGGFMATAQGVKLIEYNARFGDPEALNTLPLLHLQTDFVDVCEKATQKKLKEIGTLQFKSLASVLLYLCPEGYPQNSVKNVPITIDPDTDLDNVFFASIESESSSLVLKGSRAIGILGLGSSIPQAQADALKKIEHFKGPLFYRKDIGSSQLLEKRIQHMKQLRDK